MSLATRCTHCGTIFKIVQDQLKVSEGWVRCGRCNEIFNALPGLFDLEREPPPPRPKPRTPPATGPEPTAPAASTPAPASAASPPPAEAAALRPPEPEAQWEKTAPIRPSMIAAAREAAASAPQPSDVASPEPAPQIEDDLPPAPSGVEGTTDFDLDTSVAGYVDKPSTVTQAVQSLNLSNNPQPWLGAPPEEDVPATDESDALDSRYLMPSTRERKASKRRHRAPETEFADAEFPDDAFLDAAEDEWASGFGHSGLHAAPDASTTAPTYTSPLESEVTTSITQPLEPSSGIVPPTSEFVPERALEPPSKRTGKPGTRGRDPAAQTPEFMRRAHRQAFWRHPITRTVLSLIGLTLLATLGLQVTHHFRDLVAAHHPNMRPYLNRWCAYAGCTIKPPMRLEELQVESATLVRASSEGPDNYRLAVVVHNRAAIDLAWPYIDLTLTDETGTVIARRAFVPSEAEWLDTADAKAETAPKANGGVPVASNTPPAAPADRSTTLLWHLRAPDIKPAGYTAELFYP
ncbi:MAG: zinc-ribbon and DUF3426 domain-containing protein [Acidobacteriota bacterium]